MMNVLDKLCEVVSSQTMSPWLCPFCVVGVLLASTCDIAQAGVNSTSILGPYKVSSITISGVSSGAYMAVQMHVSFSKTISGVAAFAGVSFVHTSRCSHHERRLFTFKFHGLFRARSIARKAR